MRLVSPYGAVRLPVLVSDRVQGKELFLPLNDAGEGAVNLLTSSLTDRDTHTPAYKELAVRMEVLQTEGGGSPLPKSNPRLAQAQPQAGVAVEQKWKRPDYTPPWEQELLKGGK